MAGDTVWAKSQALDINETGKVLFICWDANNTTNKFMTANIEYHDSTCYLTIDEENKDKPLYLIKNGCYNVQIKYNQKLGAEHPPDLLTQVNTLQPLEHSAF